MDGEASRNKLDRSSGPRSLPLKYLREITNDFSDEQLLGAGGFGKVYKGVRENGDMIAVKKLMQSVTGVHDTQFENEAHHLMRLKHQNIVQLVGYCSETEIIPVPHNGRYVEAERSERLLCLEYLPNGTLRQHLSDESSGLDWEARYRIIEGICSGLHYLHEEQQVDGPIIHMDLKPANILLDKKMVPKIADFGLSRLFGVEKTQTRTQSRDGTLGYMAPEYINKGIITKKLDIFSLGVIILEIITGHKDYPDESATSYQEFIERVTKNWRNRMEKTPWYTSLEIDCQQLRQCILIGLVCVKLDRAQRPTAEQIIKMLPRSVSADFSDGKVLKQPAMLKPLANEVLEHLANTSSKAARTCTSLEWNGQPKRRLLETNLNSVEANRMERPAKRDSIDFKLLPLSGQDARDGDGGGGTGTSDNACVRTRTRPPKFMPHAGADGVEFCVNNARLWMACAGPMCTVPPVGAAVYYFPQGHAEQASAAVDLSAARILPFVPCRVVGVRLMANPQSDEVFANMRLVPLRPGEPVVDVGEAATEVLRAGNDQEKPASFVKILTQADVSSSSPYGRFDVPPYCAENIFPNFCVEEDWRNVMLKDMYGNTFLFVYQCWGTPRRYRLTMGWNSFVEANKLLAGDSIVFLRGKGSRPRIGFRRAKRGFCVDGGKEGSASLSGWNCNRGQGEHSNGKIPAEDVLAAATLAAAGQPFEVVDYPRAGSPEFCVRAAAFSAAMQVQWCPGMRFKMAVETQDSSQISWFTGTIAGVQAADPARWPESPWRLLQVTWDKPDLLQHVKRVCPWQMELV